jgi:hypothetical protein
MTDDQINEAIATASGWKGCPECNDLICEDNFIPNYCKDLNAMHKAEWSLTDDQLWRMAREIERNDEQWYFRATARQRAEAFLRTLGKWKEAK